MQQHLLVAERPCELSPALKSRAKLTRSLPRPGKRWLHYFFKDHQRRVSISKSVASRSDGWIQAAPTWRNGWWAPAPALQRRP